MTWELVRVIEEPDWIQDESGVYVMIHRLLGDLAGRIQVRLDLHDIWGIPIRSWQGSAAAVRKAAIRWINGWYNISHEHASYIGEQLARAELLSDYVQD